MADPRTVFIGDVARDEYVHAEQWPALGTKIMVSDGGSQAGGMIANAAAVYAALGGSAVFHWEMSDTDLSRLLTEELAQHGVDISSVVYREGLSDSRNVIVLCGDDHTVLCIDPGLATIRLSPEVLSILAVAPCLYTAIGDLRSLRIPGMPATGPIQAVDRIRSAGTELVLDLDVADLEVGDAALLRRVDILLVNDVGYRRLGDDGLRGELGLPDIAELWHSGLKILVHTRGARGVVIDTSVGDHLDLPGLPVPVADVTGAGDTFGAAFLFAWQRAGDIRLAAEFAQAAAARAVTRQGARGGVGSVAEIAAFLAGSTSTTQSSIAERFRVLGDLTISGNP